MEVQQKMPNPHFDISIVKRKEKQSAIAGAAYQSNDRLYSEYDLKFKDYPIRKNKWRIYVLNKVKK